MLQTLVSWAAILGFLVAAALAVLRFVEWRAKPDLRLSMDWIVGGGPSTLIIVAENRGRSRGGVRSVVVSPSASRDPATSFAFLAHMDALPVMLDPGAFARFPIELKPEDTTSYTTRLLGGGFTHAILIDQDEKAHAFPIPPQPGTDDNMRRSLYGRVAKR